MTSTLWDEYYETLTICGCSVAAVLNFFAVPLSIRLSKYSLGSFKIIMLVFSTNNMLHMLTDVFILPRFYFNLYFASTYCSGVMRHLGDTAATIGGLWSCVIFMMQILLEAVHFLYRYVLLCRNQNSYLLSVKNVSKILFITYLVYFLLMTALFTLLANYDDEIYDAIGNHSLGKVGLPARELHGSAFLLLKKNADGGLSIHWKGCLAVLCVLGANGVLIASMFYFGYKIHASFKDLALMSSNTLEMHKTLFKMLVAQTAVPLILLHIPCVYILIGPFFWELGIVGELCMIAILSYSIFEPMIVVYFLTWKQIKKALKVTLSNASSKIYIIPPVFPASNQGV